MSLPRQDVQTTGYQVSQFQDTKDVAGNAYDFTFKTITNIPINYGARYTITTDADGFIRFGTVAGTAGPIGPPLIWPGKSPRVASQVFYGGVPAQITSVGPPILAVPILNADGGTATQDPNLDSLTVNMIDGSTPTVNDFVTVMAGTNLGVQKPIAFKGGGGSSLIAFRVASLVGSGIYNGVQIDPVLGTDIAGGISTARLQEMNLSNNVGVGSKVYAQKETSGGNTYYVFVLPMAACV